MLQSHSYKIRISKDLHKRWSDLHKKQATSGSEILRRFMEEYIKEKSEPGIKK